MPNLAAERWNEKYTQESELWLGIEPRQLLVSFIKGIPTEGLALDAACGVGTNAVYMGQHGLNVIGIDISEFALRLAQKRADLLGISLDLAVADLARPWLPPEFFDVITNFHFLERAAVPVFRQALKPGGCILFDTFMATSNTIDTPDFYLAPGELKDLFEGFEIIYYAEEILEPSERHGERGIAQIVARKPAEHRK